MLKLTKSDATGIGKNDETRSQKNRLTLREYSTRILCRYDIYQYRTSVSFQCFGDRCKRFVQHAIGPFLQPMRSAFGT
jgi:hypothetical protein